MSFDWVHSLTGFSGVFSVLMRDVDSGRGRWFCAFKYVWSSRPFRFSLGIVSCCCEASHTTTEEEWSPLWPLCSISSLSLDLVIQCHTEKTWEFFFLFWHLIVIFSVYCNSWYVNAAVDATCYYLSRWDTSKVSPWPPASVWLFIIATSVFCVLTQSCNRIILFKHWLSRIHIFKIVYCMWGQACTLYGCMHCVWCVSFLHYFFIWLTCLSMSEGSCRRTGQSCSL